MTHNRPSAASPAQPGQEARKVVVTPTGSGPNVTGLEPAPNRFRLDGNCCDDFDADCRDVSSPLSCWMYNQTQGYCPCLMGTAR